MKKKDKCTAIVLAAGRGSRMGTDTRKQFLELGGRPLVCYSLSCLQDSAQIDEIILVTSDDCIDWCRQEIVEKYGYDKVRSVVPGGKERYDSVEAGLAACTDTAIVLVHDSARPFLTEEILENGLRAVQKTGACVTAVPSKDTVKLSGEDGYVAETPARDRVWIIQTPQIFRYDLLTEAYKTCREKGMQDITDDAMVVERGSEARIAFAMGSYENIKITTPSDLLLAEMFRRKV